MQTLTAGGVAITITQHFKERWEERIGGRMALPLAKIAAKIGPKGLGKYRVCLPSGAWVLLARNSGGISLVTVVAERWARGHVQWVSI